MVQKAKIETLNMPSRYTDFSGVLHMQSERVFCSDHEWFFCTREGIGIGPYSSEELAKSRGKELARRLSNLSDKKEITAAIRNFVFETTGLTEPGTLQQRSV